MWPIIVWQHIVYSGHVQWRKEALQKWKITRNRIVIESSACIPLLIALLWWNVSAYTRDPLLLYLLHSCTRSWDRWYASRLLVFLISYPIVYSLYTFLICCTKIEYEVNFVCHIFSSTQTISCVIHCKCTFIVLNHPTSEQEGTYYFIPLFLNLPLEHVSHLPDNWFTIPQKIKIFL